MELFIDFLFELVLEGALEASFNKKLPVWLRLLLIFLIIGFYAFLIYVALSVAIDQKSEIAFAIAAFILLIVVLAVRKKYKEYKER